MRLFISKLSISFVSEKLHSQRKKAIMYITSNAPARISRFELFNVKNPSSDARNKPNNGSISKLTACCALLTSANLEGMMTLSSTLRRATKVTASRIAPICQFGW